MAVEADIEVNLPLTEATFFILLSIAPQPKHGYAILKDVQSLSHNRIILSTGTLYGALKRLLGQKWIERIDEEGLDDTGRTRKAYTLTDRGRQILVAEVKRLETLVQTAHLSTVKGRTP